MDRNCYICIMKKGNILVVDDKKEIRQAVGLLLGQYFAKVVEVANPDDIEKNIEDIDVVLLDMNFRAKVTNGNEGLYHLDRIKAKHPDIQVVVFTAYAEIDLAVEAIRRGAVDFVVKPWDNAKLVASIQNAYNLRRSQRDIRHIKELKNELTASSDMYWGTSDAMSILRKTVGKVSGTDANILITGENGTGKEVLAREIHNLSLRRNELMVTVDLGAVPESLFESELFGHTKGAFTDAHEDRAGKFEVASDGTIFLDEIGNLPYKLQAKLLSALQTGSITRIGSVKPIDINARIICATNRDIEAMVAEGTFREDLMYRINTIHLHIPPLRERKEDIMPLAEIFLREYARKYARSIDGFSADAVKAMMGYEWYGNIRELRHTVEKAVIMTDGGKIAAADLLLRKSVAKVPKESATTLEEIEASAIRRAINELDGNMSAVASRLGITRQTLYNKIKKYGL